VRSNCEKISSIGIALISSQLYLKSQNSILTSTWIQAIEITKKSIAIKLHCHWQICHFAFKRRKDNHREAPWSVPLSSLLLSLSVVNRERRSTLAYMRVTQPIHTQMYFNLMKWKGEVNPQRNSYPAKQKRLRPKCTKRKRVACKGCRSQNLNTPPRVHLFAGNVYSYSNVNCQKQKYQPAAHSVASWIYKTKANFKIKLTIVRSPKPLSKWHPSSRPAPESCWKSCLANVEKCRHRVVWCLCRSNSH
jgi:hypothetical protein